MTAQIRMYSEFSTWSINVISGVEMCVPSELITVSSDDVANFVVATVTKVNQDLFRKRITRIKRCALENEFEYFG